MFMHEIRLGKKIIIVGVSASGKTSLARALGVAVGIEPILMDEIMWKPGWEYVGDDNVVQQLDQLSVGEKWVIEGYISKKARTFLFDRADTIIYLDYPRAIATWRYIKRWWCYRKDARPELLGSPDHFSFTFLKLVWTKGEAISLKKFLDAVEDRDKIIRLTSPKETRDLLKGLK